LARTDCTQAHAALCTLAAVVGTGFGGKSRMSGDVHVRLCVQLRLACSAGVSPAGVEVRGPVAWIAGWRETKTLKPIDRHFLGECASHRAVTKVNVDVASKMKSSEGRARNREGEGSMGSRNLTDTAIPLRRGGSDGTMTRTCQATGEALLAPARNRRSKVGPITGEPGKWIEGERVADGSVVAMKSGNADGAKGPCCL